MDRAYSILEIKSVNEDQRIIEGIATTPAPDREGDIIDPMGATFAKELPLLWQHISRQPVGNTVFGKPTPDGIPFKAQIASIDEPGPLKDRLDEAWQSVKLRLVRAVSIGFRALEYAYMDAGGVRFIKTEILELSLVTIPANAEATITSIKSIDNKLRAALGKSQTPVVRLKPPGASGKPASAIPAGVSTKALKEQPSMKTISEQITDFEKARTEKALRMTAIMTKSASEGTTLDGEAADEYDQLDLEVKEISKHVNRLRSLEGMQAEKAVPVTGVKDDKTASEVRGGKAITVKGVNLPKGTAFTRYAMALALGKGNLMQSAELSKKWDDTPEVQTVLKAAVAAGNTTDSAWAAPLVEYQNIVSEFAELLRPQTIIGRIQGLRNVPFNIKVPRQTSGSSATWVGQTKPIGVSKLGFDQVSLGMAKLAGIVVFNEELMRSSSPAVEAIVRQDLSDTIIQTMDRDFVNPAKAIDAGISPASITNGVTPTVASGKDADDLRADAKALMASFLAANLTLSTAVWIMSETAAMGIALMTNALGQPEFPTINGVTGGTLFGLPVILSENVPANAGTGSPVTGAGDRIILVKASEILLADEGQVLLDASSEASLQMDSAPTDPPVAATVMISLWQEGLVGIRAMRFINWAKRRPGAAQFIDQANYGE